jgi:subtilase family serine protease
MPKAAPITRILAVTTASCAAALAIGIGSPSHPATVSFTTTAARAAVTSPAGGSARTASAVPALPRPLVAPAQRRASTSSAVPVRVQSSPVLHAASTYRTVHSCSQNVPAGQFACFAERRTDLPAQPAVTPGDNTPQLPTRGLRPVDLAAAYGLPTTSGGVGQQVFIVDAYDDPNAEDDLANYRSQLGLPECSTGNGCFSKINQRGQSNTATLPVPNIGWSGEISLDLDMVSAICPNCAITLIEADDPSDANMFAAVDRANLLGAKFVSMSWGAPERGQTHTYDNSHFAATGVVYTAASGDDGYAAGVIYPATSPRVVAVGGTALKAASSTSRGWTESAWTDAGSGCSREEAPASWQAGIAPCSKRATTDVSAVADPHTGVAVYQTYGAGGWTVYGGTSAAAPIIAATYALAGTPDPDLNPANLLYRHPGSLYDVTSGNNGSCSGSAVCTAGQGWDGPTGLGTPHGLNAFQLGRSAHSTDPGGVMAPGWPHRPQPTIINSVVPDRP